MLWFLNREFILWMSTSAADAETVNPDGMSTLLGNGVGTFFINGTPTLINGQRTLSRYHPSLILIFFSDSF